MAHSAALKTAKCTAGVLQGGILEMERGRGSLNEVILWKIKAHENQLPNIKYDDYITEVFRLLHGTFSNRPSNW